MLPYLPGAGGHLACFEAVSDTKRRFETPGSSIVSARVGSWSVPFVFSVQRYLHGVIDLAVRSLDPATENVSRESYGALHPDNTRPHQVTWACPRFTARKRVNVSTHRL